MGGFKTLQDAIIHFSDFENCKKVMVQLRWHGGVVKCPYCGSEKVTYLAKNRVWKCYTGHEKPKFSLKTGTIFEDSPLGLDKWLSALWLVVNCKNGISSCELARDLGVTQKTAWFMAHRLRFSLKDGGSSLLSGEVEADETFIGGKARNMHIGKRQRRITGTGTKDKTAVMGIMERAAKFVLPSFRIVNATRYKPRSRNTWKQALRFILMRYSVMTDWRVTTRIR